MAITITTTDPQDHAPYELQALAQYFQALANDKQVAETSKQVSGTLQEATDALRDWAIRSVSAGPVGRATEVHYPVTRTTHDEELLSDEERAALHDTIAVAGLEESAAEAIAGTSAALRASAGGDQEPYAVNAGGSDDFAELRDDPKPDASTPAAASDGKTAPAGLDSSGLPWDERIHSSSKAQNADGTWRYKRGGDLDERKRVEAELRGKPDGANADTAHRAPDTSASASSSTNSDQPAAQSALASAGSDEDVPPPPPADDDIPPPPVEVEEDLPPPPPPVEEEPVDMGKVFRAITEGQKAGLTQDKLAACLKTVGLTATQDIIGKPVEILAPLLQLIKEASV